MAKINTTGLEEIEKMFVSQSETVEKAADAMLNAGADVLVEYQKTEAARLKRSGRSMGGLEKSIKKTKIKASATERSIEVYPYGTDKNHTKKGVPNAEKGFVLEYGRSDTRRPLGCHWQTKKRRTRCPMPWRKRGIIVDEGKVLKKALESLGYPVSRLYSKEKASTYITYYQLIGTEVGHWDDDNSAVEAIWRIDLYSKEKYTEMVKKIIKTIKASGFYGVTREAESYEKDTGYCHITLEAKFLEECD